MEVVAPVLADLTTDVFSIVLAGAALAVSLVSLAIAARVRRGTQISDVCRGYSLLSDLRVEHPETAHLLELSLNYERAISLARRANLELNPTARHELSVRERAVAVRVFSLYEEVRTTHSACVPVLDRKRKELLGQVVAYFETDLMQNPRLRFLWAEDGGNLRIYFSDPEQYEARLKSQEASSIERDSQGPFP